MVADNTAAVGSGTMSTVPAGRTWVSRMPISETIAPVIASTRLWSGASADWAMRSTR